MINFEPQIPMPSLDKPATEWSVGESCSFASRLYNSFYYAITMALIRHAGHEKTYEIHAHLLRHHQEHFFLDGLRKLRLDREASDAVRCAKYHCLSNAVGGVRTGYAIESPNKAWLFYFPHTPDNAWPGQAAIVHSRGNMMSDYDGWHGNNGKLLGNAGLRYVATHFLCDGDPYDGGYFEDTGRELRPDELVTQSLGEEVPQTLKIQTARFDPEEWPADRSEKALRKYAVTWAADRVWSILNRCDESKDFIARTAIQAVLYAWMPRFRSAFAPGERRSPVEELTAYISAFHSVTGLEVSTQASSSRSVIQLRKNLSSFVGGEQTEAEQVRFNRVIGGAWEAVGRQLGVMVSSDEAGSTWIVEPAAL